MAVLDDLVELERDTAVLAAPGGVLTPVEPVCRERARWAEAGGVDVAAQ